MIPSSLLPLATGALLALAAGPLVPLPTGTPPVPGTGTFVVHRVNGRPLPFDDRFSTTPGYEHRVHLDRMLVRLDPRGTFTMTVVGAYKDAPQALPGGAGASRDEVVRGRWVRRGHAITLTPERTGKGRQYPPAEGTLTGAGLTLRYTVGWSYGGRAGSRSYQLGAALDPSYL